MFKKGKERLPDRSVVEDGGNEIQEAAQALMQCLWAAVRTLGLLPAVMRSQRGGKGMYSELMLQNYHFGCWADIKTGTENCCSSSDGSS